MLLAGTLSSRVLRSAAWSAWSLMGRESRVERKDFAKEISVIAAVENLFDRNSRYIQSWYSKMN